MVSHLYSDDDKTKNPRIAAVQTAFPFGGTINPPTPNIVPPKEHAVDTAATLDYIIITMPTIL